MKMMTNLDGVDESLGKKELVGEENEKEKEKEKSVLWGVWK